MGINYVIYLWQPSWDEENMTFKTEEGKNITPDTLYMAVTYEQLNYDWVII